MLLDTYHEDSDVELNQCLWKRIELTELNDHERSKFEDNDPNIPSFWQDLSDFWNYTKDWGLSFDSVRQLFEYMSTAHFFPWIDSRGIKKPGVDDLLAISINSSVLKKFDISDSLVLGKGAERAYKSRSSQTGWNL